MQSHLQQSTSPVEPSFFSIPNISSLTPFQKLLLFSLAISFIVINFSFFRLASILSRENRRSASIGPSATRQRGRPAHLLIVLGSGGHTAEMLNILSTSLQSLREPFTFAFRTYIVSSGDSFSAQRAHEFESSLTSLNNTTKDSLPPYDVITVQRARKVHQPLFTAPFSSLRCLWECVRVLNGSHPDIIQGATPVRGNPDLILTNGPATGVIVILASILLLFFGFGGTSTFSASEEHEDKHDDQGTVQSGQMRSIYIESWARVQTLSLSGRLLKPLVDRFIVQWPQLVEKEGKRVEYIGPLIT